VIRSSSTTDVFRTIAEKLGMDPEALVRCFEVRFRSGFGLSVALSFTDFRAGFQLPGFLGETFDLIDGVWVPMRGGVWEGQLGQHDMLSKSTRPTTNNPARVKRRKLQFKPIRRCDLCQQPLSPAAHAKGGHLVAMTPAVPLCGCPLCTSRDANAQSAKCQVRRPTDWPGTSRSASKCTSTGRAPTHARSSSNCTASHLSRISTSTRSCLRHSQCKLSMRRTSPAAGPSQASYPKPSPPPKPSPRSSCMPLGIASDVTNWTN
jgi:hypothetical protein